MKTVDNYITVRLPRSLGNKIDEILKSGLLGYRSRAELVAEAVRLRLELLHFKNNMKNHDIRLLKTLE